MAEPFYGYAGAILRVDLTHGEIATEPLSPFFARTWVGGTGFGARILWEEVPAGVAWDDPENRIVLASGVLGGTRVGGSGTFSAVFKGPMTNLAGATQASGFFGAFLRLSGFDAVVIRGAAPEWSYLYIHDGTAELRDARHLLGKDTWETEEAVAQDLGLPAHRVSVYSIGPAGEHRVRFAALVGDRGHVAAHNGVGAVFGAKRLKAVAVARGSRPVPVHDRDRLAEAAERLFQHASTKFAGGTVYKYGTGGLLPGIHATGMLPVKNYTTSVFPEYEKISGQYLRTHFDIHAHPCWACRVAHVKMVRVTEGPYAGYEGEEPEYECLAAWGSQIGNADPGAVVMLSNLTDRLGLDANESSWVAGWLMECREKGLLSPADLDGLDLAWGDVEGVARLLHKIAWREGCGDWLAEGVMRASQRLGGEAPNLGIYTLKGASPRSHDHRGRWYELLDTCLSNTSTIEASFGQPPDLPGAPKLTEPFNPEQVSTVNAVTGGWRQFEDCLGICRFCSTDPLAVVDCVNAVAGWNLTTDDALEIGRRAINQLRAFNFRHGLDPALEAPAPRYASQPVDGPAAPYHFAAHFPQMKRNYWEKMGWDVETGKPLPQTLRRLGLEDVIPALWPERG